MPYTVGIAGMSGRFGRSVAKYLLQNPDITVRGYLRDPSKLPEQFTSSPRVELHKGDANDGAALRAFARGADVVICAWLGDDGLMVDAQKRLVDIAEEEGVARFFASDWTGDYEALDFGDIPTKNQMKHVKAHLDKKEKIKGVHVLIGAFIETLMSPFFKMLDVEKKTFWYWGTGDEVWELTTYENAAEFTAVLAADPEAVGVQKFLGDRLTSRQFAHVIESAYGIKLELDHRGSLDDLYRTMKDLQQKDPANWVAYLPLLYTYYFMTEKFNIKVAPGNAKYPQVKPISMEEWFKSRKLEDVPKALPSVGLK